MRAWRTRLRAELRFRIKTGAAQPWLPSSAKVGKPKWASGARLSPSWQNIEAPTAVTYVGYDLNCGHPAAAHAVFPLIWS